MLPVKLELYYPPLLFVLLNMPDAHKNFAESLIAVAPVPANAGTSIEVTSGEGGLFPSPPFQATIWPAGVQPTAENAAVVRVTAVVGDVFTIQRGQEGAIAKDIEVGDQIAATLTAKVMFDAENPVVTWSPFIIGAAGASGLQTLSSTSQYGTGSLMVFPITVPQNMQFNQIIIGNSFSYMTGTDGANTVQGAYVSKFGLYSLSDSSVFNLISSNSFSIGETLRSVSLTWNYPTVTLTRSYGYGGFDAGYLSTTNQIVSFISNTRAIGLQFNGNVYLGEGRYWLGLLGYKASTAGTLTFGLSNVGIYGQIMNAVNIGGNSSGPLAFGIAASQWTGVNNQHFTQWRGRHIAGFITNTNLEGFSGSLIPQTFSLSNLSATAGNIVSVLPSVTFVST
jgi:hypothetical protein